MWSNQWRKNLQALLSCLSQLSWSGFFFRRPSFIFSESKTTRTIFAKHGCGRIPITWTSFLLRYQWHSSLLEMKAQMSHDAIFHHAEKRPEKAQFQPKEKRKTKMRAQKGLREWVRTQILEAGNKCHGRYYSKKKLT